MSRWNEPEKPVFWLKLIRDAVFVVVWILVLLIGIGLITALT